MTEYVIDASALVLALGGKTEVADKLRARLPGMRRHAPHLIDAEVGNVLRRHEQAGLLSSAEAHAALRWPPGHSLITATHVQEHSPNTHGHCGTT